MPGRGDSVEGGGGGKEAQCGGGCKETDKHNACHFLECANHHKAKEVQVEQRTVKGKGKVLLEWTRCTDCRLECELRPGKSTSCVACWEAKLKCEQPGMEVKGKLERWRKQVEEKLLQGKKKKVQTMEESEAGPSGKKTKELEAVIMGTGISSAGRYGVL